MFFGGCSCAGMCHSNLDAHFDCFPFSLPLVSFANASTNLNLKDILPKSSQANSCKAYSNIYIINLLWYFSVQIAFLVVPFNMRCLCCSVLSKCQQFPIVVVSQHRECLGFWVLLFICNFFLQLLFLPIVVSFHWSNARCVFSTMVHCTTK